MHRSILCLITCWLLAISSPVNVAVAQTAPRRSGGAEALPSAPPAAAAKTPAAAAPVGVQREKNLVEIFHSGGVLMWPILFCSVVMMVFVFERAICLRRGNILPRPFITRFILQLEDSQLTQAEALKRCEENGSPIAQVFGAAVRKWGRSSVEVEQAMLDAGERVANTLRRNLRVLGTIHTISPLLGLLGTVFGMIDCFDVVSVSQTMGRPDLLAAGISVALITTAAGLAVAIPALCLYLYFCSCADRRIVEIDALGQQVVQLISGDSPQATGGRPSKASSKKAA
jgi:biopolymer transport protein ExbB